MNSSVSKTSQEKVKTELSKARLLLVDDEPHSLRILSHLLEKEGYAVVATQCPKAACEIIERDSFDLVITDYMMPGMTGGDLILEANRLKPDLPIILCSGYYSSRHHIIELRENHKIKNLRGIIDKYSIGNLTDGLIRQIELILKTAADRVNESEQIPRHTDTKSLELLPLIVGGLLHDARNTLLALSEKVRRLGVQISAGQNERQTEAISQISILVQSLNHALTTTHQVARESYTPAKGGELKVGDKIDAMMADLSGEWPNAQFSKSVDIDIEDAPLPHGVSLFVIRELLRNAAKACRHSDTAQISLEARMADNSFVVFRCSNSHGAFPENKLCEILRRSVRPERGVIGSGYGLYFISEMAHRLGGHLKAENGFPTGAVVELSLPTSIHKR